MGGVVGGGAGAARLEGPLIINGVIYAEVSQRYSRKELLDHELPQEVFIREHLPWSAAFLAGKAYLGYRRRGGPRRSPLPDFFIGAHAAVADLRLADPRFGSLPDVFPRP